MVWACLCGCGHITSRGVFLSGGDHRRHSALVCAGHAVWLDKKGGGKQGQLAGTPIKLVVQAMSEVGTNGHGAFSSKLGRRGGRRCDVFAVAVGVYCLAAGFGTLFSARSALYWYMFLVLHRGRIGCAYTH